VAGEPEELILDQTWQRQVVVSPWLIVAGTGCDVQYIAQYAGRIFAGQDPDHPTFGHERESGHLKAFAAANSIVRRPT